MRLHGYRVGDRVLFQGDPFIVKQVSTRDIVIEDAHDSNFTMTVHYLTITPEATP